MALTSTERRMVENEVYFRTCNNRILESIDEVNKIAKAHGEEPLTFDRDSELHFLCECSDEKCTERLRLSLNEYEECHAEKDLFIVKHDHETVSVETVISKTSEYSVVKKKKLPPKNATRLHPTHLNNQ